MHTWGLHRILAAVSPPATPKRRKVGVLGAPVTLLGSSPRGELRKGAAGSKRTLLCSLDFRIRRLTIGAMVLELQQRRGERCYCTLGRTTTSSNGSPRDLRRRRSLSLETGAHRRTGQRKKGGHHSDLLTVLPNPASWGSLFCFLRLNAWTLMHTETRFG